MIFNFSSDSENEQEQKNQVASQKQNSQQISEQNLYPQTSSSLNELQTELNERLKKLSLKNNRSLEDEILDTTELINIYERKGEQIEVDKLKHTRNYLEETLQIQKELLEPNIIMEMKLNELLKKLNINSRSLENEIKDTTDLIGINKRMGKDQEVELLTQTKNQLEQALELQIEISKIKIQKEQQKNSQKQFQSNISRCSGSQEDNQEDNLQSKYNTFQKINYDDLVQDICQTPESSEKLILLMIKYCLELQEQHQFKSDELTQQISSIQQRLKIEEQNFKEIESLIQSFHQYIQSENLDQIVQQLERILKKIRPLNVWGMNRLIQQSKTNQDQIKDQDVILFLGKTGSGKSTTIHHLAGSKMIELKVEVSPGSILKYIGPDPQEIKNKALQQVSIGYKATSETRLITPVLVNFSDFDISQNGSIILCDSPGFGDTAGPEVDIANGIGIVETIKQCKSVRPVILISYKSIGDKGEGVKELAHLLVRFVQDIEDKLSSFSYLFTKFPENANINSELINIKKSVNDDPEYSSDEAFMSLFDDMIKKTKKLKDQYQPLKDKPKKVLKKLIKRKGIQDTGKVFQFSITPNSTAAIQEQAQINQQIIISALNRYEFELIKFKLDELKLLKEILNQQQVIQTYEYCVNHIKKHLNQQHENAIQLLNNQINKGNKLDVNDVKQYEKLTNQFAKCKILREHLGADTSQESLQQQLQSEVNRMFIVFDEEKITTPAATNNLQNIKLISETFPHLKENYNLILKKINQKIDDIFSKCNTLLDEKEFTQLYFKLIEIKQLQNQFKMYIDSTFAEAKLEKLQEQFKLIIDQTISNIKEILKQHLQNEEEITKINEQISFILDTERNIYLGEHFDIKYVEIQRKNLKEYLVEQFEQVIKQFNEQLDLETELAYSELQKCVDTMNQFMKIIFINYEISNLYHQSIKEIQSSMQQIQKTIEVTLTEFKLDIKNVNFQRIKKNLKQLKQFEWMNKINEGSYKKTLYMIEEEIISYMQQQIIEKLDDCDLSLSYYKNIKQASQLVKQAESISIIQDFLPELAQQKQIATNLYLEQIVSVFKQISEYMGLSYQNINNKKESNDILKQQNNLTQEKEEEEKQIGNEIKSLENSSNENQVKIQINNCQKLDGTEIESFLNYLDACLHCKFIKKEAITLKNQLQLYLSEFVKHKTEEMQKNFEFIIDLNNDDKIKQQKGIIFSVILTGFQELQKFPLTNNIIQSDIIISKQKNNLKNYLIFQYEDANDINIDNSTKLKKNNILKILIQADQVLGESEYLNGYKSQQKLLNDEIKERHQDILQIIEKNDFKNVSTKLLEIERNPQNQKSIDQLQQRIQSQIEILLDEAKTKQQYLSRNIEKEIVSEISEKFHLINKAKQYLKNEMKPEFLTQIENTTEYIFKFITERIDKYIDSIMANLIETDFFEAEEKREYISQIYSILSDHMQTTTLKDKLEQIQKELESKVDSLTNIKYSDENNLTFFPPKKILGKLSKVKGRSDKYTQCFIQLSKQLLELAQHLLIEIQTQPEQFKTLNKTKLDKLINCLPEDAQLTLKQQQSEAECAIEKKLEAFKDDFEQASKSELLSEKQQFIERCKEENMTQFEERMKKKIQEQSDQIFQEFDAVENEQNQAIKHAIKLFKYYKQFQNQDKLKSNFELAQSKIKKIVKGCGDYLKTIKEQKETEYYEMQYELFYNYLSYMQEEGINMFLDTDFETEIQEIYQTIKNYFINLQVQYKNNFEIINIKDINDNLKNLKMWDSFVTKLKKIFQRPNTQSCQFKPVLDLNQYIFQEFKSYEECSKQVFDQLISHKDEVLNFIIQKDQNNNSYYQNIKKCITILKQAKDCQLQIQTQLNYETIFINMKDAVINKLNEQQRIVETAICLQYPNLKDDAYHTINGYSENLNQIQNTIEKTKLIKVEDYQTKLEKLIQNKIDKIISSIFQDNIHNVCENLILLKQHSERIPNFKQKINKRIDNWMKETYLKDKNTRFEKIIKLSNHLQNDDSPYGQMIIDEHECFIGQSISIFNQKTQKHDIKYILENIQGEDLKKEDLQYYYENFKKQYEDFLSKNLVKIEKNPYDQDKIIESLIIKTKTIAKTVEFSNNKIKWDNSVRQHIPTITAYIFAVWTLTSNQYYQEMKGSDQRQSYLMQPHDGQIVAIFRLLGLGYQQKDIHNNLVQIGTGEGKSVVLAVTSIIFALHNVEVYCVCYSEYLNQRDFDSFLCLFNLFEVTPKIKYGIFNKLCELILNKDGDIRQLTLDYIQDGFKSDGTQQKSSQNPRVLLIDEVDVFFSKEFYGNVYNPIASLKDEKITKLIQYIWKQRNDYVSLKQIQETYEYQQCIQKFKNLDCILDESIKDMIADSKNFQHDYTIQNDQIGYIEQDKLSFNITYGYKTVFAYIHEFEQGRISNERCQENQYISIKCGTFSYSEIPFLFNSIVGVTGTLSTLSESEKKIVKEYNIDKNTFIPSVFGKNNRKFAEKEDVTVESKIDFKKQLRNQINKRIQRESDQRAILVFFETKKSLDEFYNSRELVDIKNQVQVITEEISLKSELKDTLIKQASTSGKITLLTASFGRGTDFICRDQKVINCGGVHVILTFFPIKKYEEVQIMGRCARQGQDGSFSMILVDEELERVLGPDYRTILENARKENNQYKTLEDARNIQESQEYVIQSNYLKLIQEQHKDGQKFIQSVLTQNEENIKKFLQKKNQGANEIAKPIRILCLVDGTSSMGQLLNQAKNTVSVILERSSLIIKQSGKKIPENCFQLQFAVYRDYDSMKEGILQASPWESKADNLRQFLDKIKPQGGQDYEEAIEIGLWHANEENKTQEISAIILLADAPAKNENQIKQYRKQYGNESYWLNSKYGEMTHYSKEMQKLKRFNIPIHCFYLHDGAKNNFQEMASFTGGKCQKLDINKSDASDTLIKIVVEPILSNVGKQNGLGDSLVQDYLKLFEKNHK